MKRILLAVVFSLTAIPYAFAWGEEGHSIIAEIAQRRLTPQAAQAIARILGNGSGSSDYTVPSLASVSTWADEVRYDGAVPNSTYNWHFVDIPKDDDHYDPSTECPKDNPAQGDCVINELERLRNELRCLSGQDQLKALKFAVHFVGDIHQPFHTIWEELGGNQVKVTLQFKGKTCANDTCSTPPDNLHKVWDTTLIRAMEYNWQTFVDDLEGGWLQSSAAKQDRDDNIVDWAVNTHNEARTRNVWMSDNATLDQAYYDKSVPFVQQQLGLAGLRLARYLNSVFSSTQCPVPVQP
jgi:hypothetical protein